MRNGSNWTSHSSDRKAEMVRPLWRTNWWYLKSTAFLYMNKLDTKWILKQVIFINLSKSATHEQHKMYHIFAGSIIKLSSEN